MKAERWLSAYAQAISGVTCAGAHGGNVHIKKGLGVCPSVNQGPNALPMQGGWLCVAAFHVNTMH